MYVSVCGVTVHAGRAAFSEELWICTTEMAVFMSDHYVLSKGDDIQAYSIYLVHHYSKAEIDNFFRNNLSRR